MPDVTRKARQSNFEALRIVAMLMIVAHHYCIGPIQHLTNSTMSTLWLEGSLSHRLITVFFVPGGEVGVAVFFMLTGFLCVKTSGNPHD